MAGGGHPLVGRPLEDQRGELLERAQRQRQWSVQGKAKLASSSKADGSFAVKIADTPPNARVGANGQVIRSKPGAVVPTG